MFALWRKMASTMKKILLLTCVMSLLIGCTKTSTVEVERAFYFWKSGEYDLSGAEKKLTDSLKVRKLYLKFFEVGYSEAMGNFPVSKTNLNARYEGFNMNIVPTVYLKNEVFLNSGKPALDTLADNIHFLISKYRKAQFEKASDFSEYQMDCDWTPKSKENYFYFLKKLKAISGLNISCTLRLYPYKYRQSMGVPPVDRAMLMCYNLISPLQDKSRNSILQTDELALYLTPKDAYPVKIDVALPLFSWLHIYQNNRFVKVVNGTPQMLQTALRNEKPMWYEVTRDTILEDGTYLRLGDKIKSEQVTMAQIAEVQKLLLSKAHLGSKITVSLFHLDDSQLEQYTTHELEKCYTGFTAAEL